MQTTTSQRLTLMDGVPPRDDKELAVLMEAAGRLPAGHAQETIRTLLRASLGYERTGNAGILTGLADSALVSFRVRRNPDDQKVLDAEPPDLDPADVGIGMDEMLARFSGS
jgi:hypothetical protein